MVYVFLVCHTYFFLRVLLNIEGLFIESLSSSAGYSAEMHMFTVGAQS